MTSRDRARNLQQTYAARGDATGWFDALYDEANGNPSAVPWADMTPNRHLVEWLDRQGNRFAGVEALDVGCGLGDNAAELARRGMRVTAFDVSPSAVAWAERRFAQQPVAFMSADLLDPPAAWTRAFALVHETYTLQTLPRELRRRALASLAGLVAVGGALLIICRGRDDHEPKGELPWPLTKAELMAAEPHGLRLEQFESFLDGEPDPVRRFRAEFRRTGTARSPGTVDPAL